MSVFLDSPWIALFPLVWIGGWIGASVLYRLREGKAVFPGLPDGAVFAQRMASGRSLRTWWTSLGGAKNCLTVGVTRTELVVTPMFPFNLMFLPEIYGLELRIPLTAITRVEKKPGALGQRLVVHFGDKGPMELRLGDPAAFERALKRS